MLTKADRERLRKVCENATPGPWRCDCEHRDDEHVLLSGADYWVLAKTLPEGDEENEFFVAEARTMLPDALDTIDELRALLARCPKSECLYDTNGDGDCGRPACPICGPQGLNAKIEEALQ